MKNNTVQPSYNMGKFSPKIHIKMDDNLYLNLIFQLTLYMLNFAEGT